MVSFDTIPHAPLMERVRAKVSDGRVLALIEQFLTQGVLEGLEEWTSEQGSPQGAVISPLLSNVYLDPLDHQMAAAGFEMVRYADDFVVLCRTRQEAHRALELIRAWTSDSGLTLHPEKTVVVDAVEEGFEFLGYHFVNGIRKPRAKSLSKLKATLRVKTRRRQGRSLEAIIYDVNRTLTGWFAYYRHSCQQPFVRLDGWIRRRLRTILRRRQKRKGQGRGWDHLRWPNAYFTKRGLFSLVSAHALFRQSAPR